MPPDLPVPDRAKEGSLCTHTHKGTHAPVTDGFVADIHTYKHTYIQTSIHPSIQRRTKAHTHLSPMDLLQMRKAPSRLLSAVAPSALSFASTSTTHFWNTGEYRDANCLPSLRPVAPLVFVSSGATLYAHLSLYVCTSFCQCMNVCMYVCTSL